MQFQLDSTWLTLQGLHTDKIQVFNSKQSSKISLSLLDGYGPYPCAFMLTASSQVCLHSDTTKGSLDSCIQQLLQEYQDLFAEPTRLSPCRSHDHRILLTNESKTVKLRPYRHPAIQKNELEKLIKQMLDIGIIRDSHSLFASPIVMVKKKRQFMAPMCGL